MPDIKSNHNCIKCHPADWKLEGIIDKMKCPKCGLRIIKSGAEGKHLIEVHGNLDLAWYTEKIILPENLEVHGDLNLTGCTKLRNDCLKSLIVNGNIFMCNVFEFVKLPINKFQIGGRLFCKNTAFASKHRQEVWEKNEIKQRFGFQELTGRIPELDGIFD